MNAQPVTTTSATMPLVIIPAEVTQLGPQLSRLPDELLLQIFEILAVSMFPPKSRFHTSIDFKTFDILNRHYAINRIRNVSPLFASFFMGAFYENFNFAFKSKPLFNGATDYLTAIPAPVPAPHLRHHLRSMCIEIALETYYFTPQILHDLARTDKHGRSLRKIVTKTQMMAFCPSAHFLLLLTRGDYGFCNLRFLHLHIRVDDQWHKADEQFLQVLEEVKFVVKASRVELIVSDLFGDVKEEHQEVRKRIIVVE